MPLAEPLIAQAPEEQGTPPERLESRLESRLAAKVLRLLLDGEAGKSGLAAALGHKTVSGELHRQIKRLLDFGLIEMTIPEKPQSRLQKYRLTAAGRTLIEQHA